MATRLSPEDYRLLDELNRSSVELPVFRMADSDMAPIGSLTPASSTSRSA